MAARTSDELAINASAAAGVQFGARDDHDGGLRTELEGGRRQLVDGALGAARAHFEGGQDFVLTVEDRTSGWFGRLGTTGADCNK